MNNSMTSRQMANLLGITVRGFNNIVHKLDIPYKKQNNRFIFNLDNTNFADFFSSIRQALINPNLRALYSLKNIADLYQKDKKTIKTLLIENDVKIYHNGRKLIVLLVDLQRLREVLHKYT